MLASLRDAALAEWIYQSGGWITVFKEHYAGFESDVIIPLRKDYTVEITATKNSKKEKIRSHLRQNRKGVFR